ncbi:MAG: uncharacterized protein QG556_952 [Pseudomonadota bacterium]|nr:uncharacterized protein [Pseudomonadota bacterium]
MISFIILIFAGALAGLMAGLLGLGGATVMVPLYLYYFKLENTIPEFQQFHMAVGCSLAVIFVSSIVASIHNYRLKLIDYALVKKILPGLIVGIFVGTILSRWMDGLILKKLFSLFLMSLAIKLFISKNHSPHRIGPISNYLFHGIAILVGILNALFGIAGGIILVPFFIFMGLMTQKAVATSIFCAIPISFIANAVLTLSFHQLLIDWHVVFYTGITSTLFIPLGSKIGQHTSSNWLKRIFTVFLLLIAMDMAINSF